MVAFALINAANADVRTMIEKEATLQGINPKLAVAVATVESNLNPDAIGTQGEFGVFQLHPKHFAKVKLLTQEQRIKAGVSHLVYWKKNCPVKDAYTFVTCFNQGGRKPRYPQLLPYYKKVMQAMK